MIFSYRNRLDSRGRLFLFLIRHFCTISLILCLIMYYYRFFFWHYGKHLSHNKKDLAFRPERIPSDDFFQSCSSFISTIFFISFRYSMTEREKGTMEFAYKTARIQLLIRVVIWKCFWRGGICRVSLDMGVIILMEDFDYCTQVVYYFSFQTCSCKFVSALMLLCFIPNSRKNRVANGRL